MNKPKRLYRIIKGSGGGCNANTIGIEHVPGNIESLVFVSKVQKKAEELFGRGASLNTIVTTYGVHIRYEDEKKNRLIARKLIQIVKLEEEIRTKK